MEESRFQGNLADIPFVQLLFGIWQREKSGCLKIRKDKVEKRLQLERAKIVVKQGAFPEKNFLQSLAEKNLRQ